jgi:hypothetical protein
LQAGDSVTSGNLVSVIPRAIRLNRPRPDPFPSYAGQLEAIAEAAPEFDILHCNTDWIHLPLIGRLGIPHLTTFHHRLDIPDLPPVALRFPDAPLNFRSPPSGLAVCELAWDRLSRDACGHSEA